MTSLGVPDKRDLSTGSNINPPIFVPNGNNTGGLILEILPARVFGWFTCHWKGRIKFLLRRTRVLQRPLQEIQSLILLEFFDSTVSIYLEIDEKAFPVN